MKRLNVGYEVAVVGLDLTEMDDKIIEYVRILVKALHLKKIIFVHIAEKLDLPEDLLDKYPDLMAPLDESIEDGINKKVSPIFQNQETEYDIIVREGAPLENFLRVSKIKNADLVVLGRKKSLKGSGLLSGHIVRKSPASIVFVTETYKNKIDKILVPIDFSAHSVLAADLAMEFKASFGASIQFSHVYNVPIGYYKTGKSYEEFAEIMKSHATKDLKQFMIKHNYEENIPCEYLLSDHDSKAELINKFAHQSETDLILIGSRGRTKTSAMLIGSIVEKLLKLDSDIPMLVVKDKGENMGFLKALMQI